MRADTTSTEGQPIVSAKRSSNGGDRLLTLLQVSNAAFPTGTFTHSYGFETWLQSGIISNAEDAERRCFDWLRFTVTTGDAAAVALAYRACVFDDMKGIVEIDRNVSAIKVSRESRSASAMTGAALITAGQDIFALPQIARLAKKVSRGECEGHQATAYGALASGLGFTEQEAVTSFLWTSLSSLIGVVQRLTPLGQTDSQRIVASAAPLVERCAEIAQSRELDQLASSFAALDIASMRHERTKSRLCIS